MMRIDPLLTSSPVTGAVRHLTADLLAEVYLAPAASDPDLAPILVERPAPWSESFAVAPAATLRAIDRALTDLMCATPELSHESLDADRLPPGRAREHLRALIDLWRDSGAMPRELAVWRHVLTSEAHDALEPLPVVGDSPCPFSTPAEAALHGRLVAHHGTFPAGKKPPHASGALGLLQDALGRKPSPISPDDTLAIHGLRDPQEEAQMAAACAQRLLENGRVDHPSDIGLLAPDSAAVADLEAAFARGGLALSGLPAEKERRDHVGEVLLALLACLKAPAPRTALATISASPLMPWPRSLGRQIARDIIERGWSRLIKSLSENQRIVFETLHPVSNASQLKARLLTISETVGEPSFRTRVAELLGAVTDPMDWAVLHSLAEPRKQEAPRPERFLEGVSLFEPNALPWRPVRHLLVLGMAGDNWPPSPGATPFFTEAEIDQVRNETGLPLPGRRQRIARGLELFRRQLGAAVDGATLLVSSRDRFGKSLAPSTALSLLTHMLGGKEPADVVSELRSQPPINWPVAYEVVAPLENDGKPALPDAGTLQLDTDLLRTRQTDTGEQVSQSPSRLETLIVSPFAWLLGEIKARDRTWGPEALDIMIQGSIQHGVLEEIFPAGALVPDEAEILARLDAACTTAIRKEARWLEGEGWVAERASLRREAGEIARNWGRFLKDVRAEVLEAEVTLQGEYDGLPISGRADCVLGLPGGRLLIVDHKRSRSANRRERMTKGWDLQVALYGAMLQRPAEATALTERLHSGAVPITAYHTMLDDTLLTDADGAGIAGADALQMDISGNALEQLSRNLKEVGAGRITLNTEADARRFEKERGVKPYALQENPLVAAFLLPAEDAADA